MKKAQDKVYVLGMFPYPSGEGLHVGHVRIYTAVDVMARYLRMKSRPPFAKASEGLVKASLVLSPMGWDAFGLPAENAAIKAKVNPGEIVPKNYANFRRQMEDLDFKFEWEREFATTDPTYYGLTQWIFLELYKKGLVYREEVPINWCPKCKTGLANEEVLADGTHERCGSQTGKKKLPQWVMKITKYADRLLEDLEKEQLDWPRGILEMQKNWIGRREGVRVEFKVQSSKFKIKKIEVFTTRLDTIYGVTFVVISPERAKEWMENGWSPFAGASEGQEVKNYVKETLQKSEQARLAGEKEKTGIETGMKAVNPVNGEEVPVWVADYVLSDVGTGAVMGVPHYDERDREFATKHGIEVREIELVDTERIFAQLAKQGAVEKETTYHLRDWVFSRQRYWGEPIPLVTCDKCGVVPLPERDLPLTLPELTSYEPTETGESPLSRVTEWVKTTCPECGGEARRETDTMPNWAGSCWYHLAFAFWNEQITGVIEEYKHESKKPFSDFWREVAKPAIKEWLPVDWYLGGAEHAVLHLLYARFWNKVLFDLGHLEFPEPYLRLRSVGMVLAEDGRKMSKSWGNVINPDEMVKKHGSDAVRLYEMFMGPWEQAIAWDERSLIGMRRFVERVMATVMDKSRGGEKTSPTLAMELAKLIEKVGKGIVEQKFNTCIAGMMELLNLWRNENLVMSKGDTQKFAQVISPFMPKTGQSVWEQSGGEGKVEETEWPTMKVEEIEVPVTMAVQINGKLRATVEVEGQISRDEEKVMEAVRGNARVKQWMKGEPKKVIFVPARLVNLVL